MREHGTWKYHIEQDALNLDDNELVAHIKQTCEFLSATEKMDIPWSVEKNIHYGCVCESDTCEIRGLLSRYVCDEDDYKHVTKIFNEVVQYPFECTYSDVYVSEELSYTSSIEHIGRIITIHKSIYDENGEYLNEPIDDSDDETTTDKSIPEWKRECIQTYHVITGDVIIDRSMSGYTVVIGPNHA